jgi:hypothetical protein
MLHYHGTPCGGTRQDVARFLKGRHAFISFFRPEDIGTAAEVCQSFAVDNGAFSAWMAGQAVTTWRPYYGFCEALHRHPAFDWAVIPDVIDGSEEENDALLDEWPSHIEGVPVWHMHESLERLDRLCTWPRLAIGSSGEWPNPGTDKWWARMAEAMRVICDDAGRPRCKLHGLRMLDPAIFQQLPFASADSTNAVRNSSNYGRFGQYVPPNASTRMAIIAERIEAHQSAAVWCGIEKPEQLRLFA